MISDIEKIITPIETVNIEKGKYKLPGFRYNGRQLLTNHFRYGGITFVHTVPKECNNIIKVNAEDEADYYLKQFFLTRLPEKNLQERAIQQAFAINLMKKFRNWSLTMEQKLKSGRPDILFTDSDGTLVVVEIKRADNDDPVSQLERYINELKREHKKIRGLVICGKKTKDLEKAAKEKNFEIIEYSVSINFPA